MSTVQVIRKPTLRLHAADDVVIAARPLAAGTRIEVEGLSNTDAIPEALGIGQEEFVPWYLGAVM